MEKFNVQIDVVNKIWLKIIRAAWTLKYEKYTYMAVDIREQ